MCYAAAATCVSGVGRRNADDRCSWPLGEENNVQSVFVVVVPGCAGCAFLHLDVRLLRRQDVEPPLARHPLAGELVVRGEPRGVGRVRHLALLVLLLQRPNRQVKLHGKEAEETQETGDVSREAARSRVLYGAYWLLRRRAEAPGQERGDYGWLPGIFLELPCCFSFPCVRPRCFVSRRRPAAMTVSHL